MTKRLLFFATKEDLGPVLAAVERVLPIDYVRMDNYRTGVVDSYASVADIPNLGQAPTDSAGTSDEYLVVMKGRKVKTESVRGEDGRMRHLVDQLLNPSSITFAPGGLWGNDVLLHGRFATVHDDEASLALMNQCAEALRKSFRKLKAYWVGAEAERLLDSGKRLTISAQASRDFDLTRTG